MAPQEFLQTTRSSPTSTGEPVRHPGARFTYPESSACDHAKDRPTTTSVTTYSYAYPRRPEEQHIRYAGGRYTYPESAVGPIVCPKQESNGSVSKEPEEKANTGPVYPLGAPETTRYGSSQPFGVGGAGGSGRSGGGGSGRSGGGVRNINIAAGDNMKADKQQGYFGNKSFLPTLYALYGSLFGYRGNKGTGAGERGRRGARRG